ncbi:MAG: hypothetical protein JNK52_01210 [Zoogloeaceae bacterium]|nr:hypothetical protein [Zoogloeaceae bacterium]
MATRRTSSRISQECWLACTELPLIAGTFASPRTVDVTDLLAMALARRSLEARPAVREP